MSGDAPSKFCCRGTCRLTNTVRLCFARDPQFCCRWRRGVMATKSIVRGEPIVVVPHNMVRSSYSRTHTPSILLSIYLSYHPAPLSPSSPNWNSLFLSFHGLPPPSFSFSLPPSLPLPFFFSLPKNTRKHINLYLLIPNYVQVLSVDTAKQTELAPVLARFPRQDLTPCPMFHATSTSIRVILRDSTGC